MKKILKYIDGNIKNAAIFCTALSVIGSFFFMYMFDKLDLFFGRIYPVSIVVYHGIMNSNYKTRKK